MCSQSFLAGRTSCVAELYPATTVRTHELLLHKMKTLLFLCNFSIAEKENSFSVRSYLAIMSYHYNCSSLIDIQSTEQPNNFVLVFCIQVTGWFICQNDGRIIRQCSRNSYSLLLSSTQSMGSVFFSRSEEHTSELQSHLNLV